jgi:pyruvate formate lyase activating enzyme
VHDGEGIRTLVFLKGCPLRCLWCSNPESQDPLPQLARNAERCLGVEICDYCAGVCPKGALLRPASGAPQVDRATCSGCLACAGSCPAQALHPYGAERTVRQVLDEVERDSPFYARSGGGVTLSGGEPLMRSRFALALLREAKRRHLDCAVETCGQVPWEVLAEACGLLREVFFDLKMTDPDKHLQQTGVRNGAILANLRRIAEDFPNLALCVRTPVIPDVNDNVEDIGAILDFLAPYPRLRYELLPYHRFGSEKYRLLDRPFPLGEATLDGDRFARLQALVTQRRPGR